MTSARMKGLAVAAVTLLTLGASAPTTTKQPTRRALSGDLTKPLAQYTGAQFAALVRPLRYGQGATRNRRCRGPMECRNGKQVSVRVDAVADADSLGPGNLGQYGVVAARLRNTGPEMEGKYDMRSGTEYSYWLIVSNAGPGNPVWTIEELDTTQPTAPVHRTVASGRFVGCNHPFVRGARADFRTCAQSPAGRANFSPVALPQGGPDDPPIWISCASGCCIAEI